MKKIFIILSLLLIGAAGWFGWRWYSNRTANPLANLPADVSLFPEGEERQFNLGAATSSTETPLISQIDGPLTQISDRATAELFRINTASSSYVAFVEKPTGHLYQISESGTPIRLSNTTIPRIARVTAAENDQTLRLLITTAEDDRIGNSIGSLVRSELPGGESFINPDDATGLSPLQTQTVSSSIMWPTISPRGTQWAYLSAQGEGSQLVVTSFATGSPVAVYSSPLQEWLLDWPASTTITLLTKPASFVSGVFMAINPNTRVTDRVIGGVPGLTAKLSPDGNSVAYSGAAGQGVFLGRYHRPTQTVSRLPVQTISDKCGWGSDSITLYCAVPKTLPAGSYPEHWYQGKVQFNDNIWQINTSTGEASIIFNPELANIRTQFDAVSLTPSASGEQLYFINKRDGLLWSLAIMPSFVPENEQSTREQ